MHKATRGVVNIYSAGVKTKDRRIVSLIYSSNASVAVEKKVCSKKKISKRTRLLLGL
jgi:hypothetical protein